MRLVLIVSLTMVAMLMLATDAAQAIQIQNLTQGTTLFDSGGYEGETTGANPANPLAGEYKNNPMGIVRDNTTTSAPGAFEGTKYNELAATGGSGLAETFFGPVSPGNTIRISWAQHINDTPEFRMRLTGGDVGNFEAGLFDFQPTTGGVRGWNESGGYPSYTGTLATVQGDQWQTVVIEHEVGTNDVTLTLDGVSELFPGVINDIAGNGTLERIRWDNIQSAYVDSIPEPASLAMIGLGGLLALRRRHA